MLSMNYWNLIKKLEIFGGENRNFVLGDPSVGPLLLQPECPYSTDIDL
jgi:hypothetical protein